MTTVHQLKTWPLYFDMIVDGDKNFEIRYNDRQFHVLDILVLEEYDPDTGEYSGRKLWKVVTCLIDDFVGLAPGYVAMGIRDATEYEKVKL
jgi:hypothetical protein